MENSNFNVQCHFSIQPPNFPAAIAHTRARCVTLKRWLPHGSVRPMLPFISSVLHWITESDSSSADVAHVTSVFAKISLAFPSTHKRRVAMRIAGKFSLCCVGASYSFRCILEYYLSLLMHVIYCKSVAGVGDIVRPSVLGLNVAVDADLLTRDFSGCALLLYHTS